VLISRDVHARFASLGSEFPRLAERFVSATLTSSERGAVTVSRSLERVYRGSIALIGDASGSVDCGYGRRTVPGFHQALALADALEAEDLGVIKQLIVVSRVRPR